MISVRLWTDGICEDDVGICDIDGVDDDDGCKSDEENIYKKRKEENKKKARRWESGIYFKARAPAAVACGCPKAV